MKNHSVLRGKFLPPIFKKNLGPLPVFAPPSLLEILSPLPPLLFY